MGRGADPTLVVRLITLMGRVRAVKNRAGLKVWIVVSRARLSVVFWERIGKVHWWYLLWQIW